jgi:hypothetical protein
MKRGEVMEMQQRTGAVNRLFQDHPRSLGMSWWGHGVGALKIGAEMIAAGSACLIHAIVPGWFTQTAGRTVERLHDHMIRRRAGAANPNDWPDYEI